VKVIAFLLTILASASGAPPPAGTSEAPAPGTTASRDASSGNCALDALAPDAALVADCASCHGSGHDGSVAHRVGMDYAQAASARRGRFKAVAEVSQRGISLPGGKVECVSCHHPRSSWGKHIALPQGATARPAADVAGPETNETKDAAPQPAPGSRISTKPLCEACHTF
jgi:hypothetical protein